MATTTASVSVTCPNCAKVLRLSARPAKGKKIKCPSCEEAFLPELEDEETAIQAKPSAKAKASSNKSAGKKSRDEDAGPPKRRRRRDEEDEDDEDEKPSRKKKAKKSSSMMMVVLLLVGGGFLFLSCGGIGLTAFVWPGFMLSKPAEKKFAKNGIDANEQPKEKGQERPGDPVKEAQQPVVQGNSNLASYVLADATVAMGCNVKGLRKNNQGELIATAIDFVMKGNQREMPAEFTEIMRGCEKIMVSAVTPLGGANRKGPPMPGAGPVGVPSKLAIVAMLTPESFVKLRQMPGLGAEEKLAGKHGIYRLSGGKRQILAFPAARVIVLGDCNDADMTALLDGAGKGTAGPIAKMSARVEQTHFWIAGVLDGESRKLLNKLPLTPPPGAPPQAVQGLQTLPKLNGVCVGVERGAGGNWNVQLHAEFADGAAASTAKDALDALKTYALKEMANDKSAPSFAAAVLADANTLTFSSQGTLVSGTLTVNAKTVDEVMAGDRNPPTQIAKSDGGKTHGRPPLRRPSEKGRPTEA